MAESQRRGWSGSTKHTMDSGCMLGGKWWKEGDKIACIFQRLFVTKYGDGMEFMLVQPSTINVFIDEYNVAYKAQPADDVKGEMRTATRFALPALKGFDMAYQDLQTTGFSGFRFGDKVLITCVGIEKALDSDRSDMPLFEISVDPR